MGRIINCALGFALLNGILTNGQHIFLGRCLNLPVKANFQLDSYLGRWYTIAQYPNPLSGLSICQSSNYSQPDWVTERYGNGSLRIWISQVSLNGWNTIPGIATLPNITEPAKYMIDVEEIPVMEERPYWILATDYRNYSVVWSCVERAAFNFQMIWFLSRTQIASGYSRDLAYNNMRRLGINTRLLSRTHQLYCNDPRPGLESTEPDDSDETDYERQ